MKSNFIDLQYVDIDYLSFLYHKAVEPLVTCGQI